MATLGDLGLLPLEIRKEIYSEVFVKHVQEKIYIGRYIHRGVRTDVESGKLDVRVGNHRNPDLRGEVWNKSNRTCTTAPPSMTSILRASKAINSEATPVLYGDNRFWFLDPSVLADFLFRTGNSKQYLRHIAIGGNLFMWHSWASTDRWVAALIGVNSFRTLKMYHCQFVHDSEQVTVRNFIAHCKPMLAPLQVAIKARGLNYSLFDILRVSFSYTFSDSHTHALSESCYLDGNSRRLHNDFLAEMKKEITEQLGLAGK